MGAIEWLLNIFASKNDEASEALVKGAEQQRDLLAEQERLREEQARLEAAMADPHEEVFVVEDELVVGGTPAVLVRAPKDEDDVDP